MTRRPLRTRVVEPGGASARTQPRIEVRWRTWGESMRPHVVTVAKAARAAGYRGTRLRSQDRAAVEELYGQRFTDEEMRACRAFWRFVGAELDAASPRSEALRAGWRRRRKTYGPNGMPGPKK